MLRVSYRPGRAGLGLLAVLVSGIAVFGTTVIAHADVVALRDGTRYEGNLANRDDLVAAPEYFQIVSLLSRGGAGGAQMLRFAVADIDYVIADATDAESPPRVIDFASHPGVEGVAMPSVVRVRDLEPIPVEVAEIHAPKPTPPRASPARREANRAGAATVMVLGLGAILVGANGWTVDIHDAFADEPLRPGQEGPYRALDAMLMVSGSVLFLGGFVEAIAPQEGPGLAYAPDSGIGLAYRARF